MQNQFTAVYRKTDDWWVAYVEELPGAHTQGKTLEEARENLKDAVEMILAANRDLARQQEDAGELIREELMVTTA